MQDPENNDDGIVWLASYPRSGNTWMRAFLHAYLGNETVNINDMTEIRNDIMPYYTRIVSGAEVSEMSQAWRMFFRPVALYNQLVNVAVRPAIIKTHFINKTLQGHPAIPLSVTSKAIYITRDPRDVCVSLAKYLAIPLKQTVSDMNKEGFGLSNPGTIVSILNSWSEHVSSWINEKNFPVHIVRYENMKSDPVETFLRVLGFLKIEPDQDRVKRCIEVCSIENMKAQEDLRGFAESARGAFFGRGLVGGWKDILPEGLEKILIEDHAKVMRELDYLPGMELVGEAVGNI